MKPISIALIGAGYIAGEHARGLAHVPQAKLTTVFDAARDRAEQLASKHGMKVAASYSDAVKQAEIVWLCSPPLLHEAQVLEALDAGKAVFCEKPLTLSMSAARAMERAASKPGRFLAVGHSNRYYPAYQKMQQLFTEGAVGKLVSVWSQREGHYPREQFPPWRLDPATSGGMTVEVGVHEIDFLSWIGGPVETVFAQRACAVINPPDFDDTLSSVLRFQSGAFARLDLSWASGIDIARRGIIGDKGAMMAEMYLTSVEMGPLRDKAYSIPTPSPTDPETKENLAFRWQGQDVLERLGSGKPPAVGIREGVEAIALALALQKSAKENRVVKLSEM